MVELAAIIIILVFGVPLALGLLGILGDLIRSIGDMIRSIGGLLSGIWRLPPPEKGEQKESMKSSTPPDQPVFTSIQASTDRAFSERARLN